MSLSQITWLLGYEGSTSFNHAFRRWTGHSPSMARKGTLRLHKGQTADQIRRRVSNPIGPRTQKIGTCGQAAARDIAYLISVRPGMTQGPRTSYDAGKLALLQRSP